MLASNDEHCQASPSARSPLEQMGLVSGLSYDQVEKRLIEDNRACEVYHRRLAFYLNEMSERGIYRQAGFAKITHWAKAKLAMEPSTTYELIRVGKHLLELTEIDAEFAAGWLPWSKVRRLATKVRPQAQREWVELARRLDSHQLDAELQRSDGGAPRNERSSIGRSRFKVQVSLDTLAYEDLELAKQKLGDEMGHPVTDTELVEEAVRILLATNADGSVPGRVPVKESHYKVVLRCSPEQAEVVTEHGAMPVPSSQPSMLLCEGATLECDDSIQKSPPTPEPMRRAVLARDGHRCVACHRGGSLHVHHIVWREHGGPTIPSNLVSTCVACDGLVHEGFLVMEGPAHALEILDCQRLPVERRPNVAAAVASWQVSPCDVEAASLRKQPAVLRFVDLPQQVDASWWRRHQHLLSWNERRGVLELVEGVAADEESAAESMHVHTRANDHDPASARSVSLDDGIGQERAVSALRVAVAAAQHEDRPLPHVLLSGPPGVGKTTLARALGHAMQARLCMVAAPLIDNVHQLVALLVGLQRNDVLFLDELHALPRAVAEVLYGALEERRLSLPVVCRGTQRTIVVELAPFTCIGATTDEGALPEALRARFRLRESLERLSEQDVAKALRAGAARAGMAIDDKAACRLASVSRGTPREGFALLGRAHDEMLARFAGAIDEDCAKAALVRAGIDERGLQPVERSICELLADGRPRALAQIAAHIGLPAATVEKVHEPWLLRLGLMQITPRGRSAMARA